MTSYPVSDEVAAALGAFCRGGSGPTHTALSQVFKRCGYGNAAPYDPTSSKIQINKEVRITETIAAAAREPHRSQELVSALLALFQSQRFFQRSADNQQEVERRQLVDGAKRAFARINWELTDSGELRPAGVGSVVSIEGRPAIEVQLKRLKESVDDPALLIGTSKELLESTAKFVLEAFSVPYRPNSSFDELWHLARERLGLLPTQVDMAKAGANEVREILQSAWLIVKTTNLIRNDEGTGHGRTLPTEMTPEMALMVVREACSVAELVLSTLDRMMGH
jgi:hypothetical protein